MVSTLTEALSKTIRSEIDAFEARLVTKVENSEKSLKSFHNALVG